MNNLRNIIIVSGLAVAASAPAYATGGGSSWFGASTPPSGASNHVHYCGCGHAGFVAPSCSGGGSSGNHGGSSGDHSGSSGDHSGSSGDHGGSSGEHGGSSGDHDGSSNGSSAGSSNGSSWGGSSAGSSNGSSAGSSNGSSAGSSNGSSAGSSNGTNVPEPADFALFALGVAGLLIGRRSALKARANREPQDAE